MDQLSIVCLKEFHSEGKKRLSLHAQRAMLKDEIDEYVSRLKDPNTVVTFPANKVYGETVQDLRDATLGELAADIVDINIRMWHAQEVVYSGEIDQMSQEELLAYLKRATRLNLDRNNAIDAFDKAVEKCLR